MRSQFIELATWRKSSRSAQGLNNCVEVADGAGWAAVRDSKDPEGPVLTVTPEAFTAFLRVAGSDMLAP